MATATKRRKSVGLLSGKTMPDNPATLTPPKLVNLAKLPKFEQVIDRLRGAHRQMEYHSFDEKGRNIETDEKLDLQWDAGRQAHFGTFGGKRLPMNTTSIATALKFCKIPNSDWLLGKPNDRLPQTINDQMQKEGGMQVAVNQDEIRAFVNPDFVFMTDWELLHGASQSLQHLEPQGIEVIDHNSDATEYRMIFGKPITKKDQVFTMLALSSSEFGLASNVASLGSWRVSCLNGMLSCEKSHTVRWDHRGTKGTFVERMGGLLSEAQAFGEKFRILLDMAFDKVLTTDADYIAMAMYELKLLKSSSYDELSDNLGTTIIETAYDLWNVMTDTAKNLDMHARHRMEKAAALYLSNVDTVNERALKMQGV